MTVYFNYSGNYNGFRHIIAGNNNPVNSCQTRKLKSMLLGERIKELRAEHGVLQRQLAALLEIDTPMFSKIERGDRRAKRTQVIQLAEYFKIDKNELLTLWLADKILDVVENENELKLAAMEMAQSEMMI